MTQLKGYPNFDLMTFFCMGGDPLRKKSDHCVFYQNEKMIVKTLRERFFTTEIGYCLFALNKSFMFVFLFLPPARWQKMNSPWRDDSNVPSFVINEPTLAKLLKSDQAQKWVLTAEL